MEPFIINRTNLRLKTRLPQAFSHVIDEFKTIFMSPCLSAGMNDMWVIDLVKEMYLTLASVLVKTALPERDALWLFKTLGKLELQLKTVEIYNVCKNK